MAEDGFVKSQLNQLGMLKKVQLFLHHMTKAYDVKIKGETGKLVSSPMVHPEKRILLLLRLHKLEDGVEIYDLHSGKPGEEIQGNFRGDADTSSTLLL